MLSIHAQALDSSMPNKQQNSAAQSLAVASQCCLPDCQLLVVSVVAAVLQVITVGLGSAENARFFSQTLSYPIEDLYADPTGACYKALGFSPGFAPGSDINPYVKLLTMLAGVGSPGTVQEVCV